MTSMLATALSEAMTTCGTDVSVLDPASNTWIRNPWYQMHARSENVAERIIDDGASAVGVVGEPTLELIAAIPGAFMAGTGLSILPGPIRGADPQQWAHATLTRFTSIGVRTVFSHSQHLQLLRAAESPLVIHDLAEVAHDRRSTSLDLPTAKSDVAILQGTAGSTGSPRTAQISPEASLANLRGLVARIGITPSDIGCSWLPLYHDMGLTILLMSLLGGAEFWQTPTSAFSASPLSWLQWLSDSRASLTFAPNMAYAVTGKYSSRVTDLDLSNLRYALNGGEPVDCDGTERFGTAMSRFGFDPTGLSPAYGLAESTCAVTVPAPGLGLRTDHVRVTTETGESTRREAVVGEAIPGVQVRINTDVEHGLQIVDREVGEVEVRGSSMMTGYLGEQPIDADSWFPTGDLGYFVDGGLIVCGRAKEMITIAGRNVFPTEVERVAAQVDGVRAGRVVAVGVNEKAVRPGLVIAAEFRGDDEPNARSEMIQLVASECGVVPSEVVLLEPGSLPVTTSGKLRRLEVKNNMEAVKA